MDLHGMLLLLSMWACTIILFPLIIDASQPSTHSTASRTVFLSQRSLISQFSSHMEAQSPGSHTVKVVHHQELNKKIIVALIAACTILVGTLLILLCLWFKKPKRTKDSNGKSKRNLDVVKGLSLSPVTCNFSSVKDGCSRSSKTVFEYKLIEAATNNFHESNVLGGGASVYRARFDDKFSAAVKRFDKSGQDIEKEFENEINLLKKIHHQNIVYLLGYCIHDKSRFLVYEMMQKGSLETQLHGPSHGSDLNWHLRIKIAVDIARGLEYLHERCNPPVIHSNLKSSNVLLDSNFNAKLSGFSLAVTIGNQNKNIKNSGTTGYVAPEILLDGKLTDKSDVYAFGVILLELLIGRRPVEKMSPSNCQSIVTWAMPQLTDRSKLPNIMDPVIRYTMDSKHLYQVAAVAVLCVQPEPSYRPLITDVLHSLIPLLPTEFGGSLRVASKL